MVSQFSDKRKEFLKIFNTEWDITYQFYKNIKGMFNYFDEKSLIIEVERGKYYSFLKYLLTLKISNEEDFNSLLNYIIILKILHIMKYNYENISENDLNTLEFLCKKFKYCPNILDISYFYSILRDINDENYEKLVEDNIIDRKVKEAIMPFLKELGKAEYDDITKFNWPNENFLKIEFD